MNRLIGLSLVALLVPVFAFGQGGHGDQQHGQQHQQGDHRQRQTRQAGQAGQASPRTGYRGAGNGYAPARGAAPVWTPSRGAAPRRDVGPTHFNAPQFRSQHDAWRGRGTSRSDRSYRPGYQSGQGRFSGAIGRQHVWRLRGGQADRFNVGGFFFGVAPYAAGYSNGWLWNSDDIVLYPDPDHDGGYLAYNVRLGTYVQVVYLGS